ncbi:hypothetical protein [uncultured Algibacter sp.]|uniref:hypothetical protein n=1 Tax=uncultured Algibacter sp. TaxID=298659 RepID=UPI00260DE5B1|nr:hypothetical protein [uncultured Algibacter sp.]
MKYTFYIVLFFSVSIFAQESIETKFIKKFNLNADTLVSVDDFGTSYYLKNNVIYKKTNDNSITYSNLQLGTLYSANTFNPLKINLFYKDFNTVIILDNRLAEIFKIDFNTLSSYKNVSHISTGHDNTIWIFNQDIQKLELFDYKTRTTRAQTVPVQSTVLDLKSNYNFCWLLTEKYLYTYNYFGSLLKKVKNSGFTTLVESNENIILKKANSLFYIKKESYKITPITTSNLLINQFFVTNETLYIYNNKILQQFQLKIN